MASLPVGNLGTILEKIYLLNFNIILSLSEWQRNLSFVIHEIFI